MLQEYLTWMDVPAFVAWMIRFFTFGVVGVAALLAVAAIVDRLLPTPRRAERRG